MKLLFSLALTIVLSGCVTFEGVTDLTVANIDDKAHVLIVENKDAKASVLPVLEAWFSENGYRASVVSSAEEAIPENYVLTYSAQWNWDFAIYMRHVHMQVESGGKSLGKVDFDARQYGGNGKFGSAEKRLSILLDVLFGKITRSEANQLLGDS